MDWMMIIKLIMTILSVVMEFLGGGSFPKVMNPDSAPQWVLNSSQWNCDSSHWSDDTTVQGGFFSGTLTVNCKMKGTLAEGGLIELRRHLTNKVENESYRFHGGPDIHFFQGLPSNGYDVSLASETSEGVIEIRGRNEIATDGFTQLRSVFTATDIPRSGSISYLKNMSDVVEVKQSEESKWYDVTISYSSRIEKPWLIGNAAFKEAVMKQNEDRMETRKEKLLNDLASHL